jgi:hypothetical protein
VPTLYNLAAVDNERNQRKFDSVYSKKVRAGKRRTYFFDVRQTKGDDYFLTLTESTKRFNDDGFERHKIFLYKEDFNRFLEGLQEAIDHIKHNLMPEYDYDEFARRYEEEEEEEIDEAPARLPRNSGKPTSKEETDPSEEDMSW